MGAKRASTRLLSRCLVGGVILLGLVTLMVAKPAVSAELLDGDVWTASGQLNYASLGPDNRPQCAKMDVEYPVTATTGLPTDAFVRREGGKLAIGCQDFVFAGWNSWEVLELASDAPAPFRWTPKCGREHLVSVLNDAAEAGLTVVRAWAHTITKGHESIKGPGEYDNDILEGMDWFMAQAQARGIKVIWALVDNWYPVGGVDSYVEWSPTASVHQDFFSDASAKQLYRDNFEFLSQRVNTITGVKYKDDPTIMAWNLANEARCQGCDKSVMQGWIEEMCDFVKSVDPNHLVGIGHEGFYGEGSGREEVNPADWATREGQDWLENSKVPCIDYAGIHVWPDNWEFTGTEFQQKFIKEHLADMRAEMPNKPFILEEFGKIVEDGVNHGVRNEYYKAAFEVAEASAGSGDSGALAGTIFWHFYDEGVGPGKYGVRKTHTTWPLIEAHADKMNALRESRPPVC